jgi:hypothetical protein
MLIGQLVGATTLLGIVYRSATVLSRFDTHIRQLQLDIVTMQRTITDQIEKSELKQANHVVQLTSEMKLLSLRIENETTQRKDSLAAQVELIRKMNASPDGKAHTIT